MITATILLALAVWLAWERYARLRDVNLLVDMIAAEGADRIISDHDIGRAIARIDNRVDYTEAYVDAAVAFDRRNKATLAARKYCDSFTTTTTRKPS